jgi:hypothetical protein
MLAPAKMCVQRSTGRCGSTGKISCCRLGPALQDSDRHGPSGLAIVLNRCADATLTSVAVLPLARKLLVAEYIVRDVFFHLRIGFPAISPEALGRGCEAID